MPKVKETNVQKYEKVAGSLDIAIGTIQSYCGMKGIKFDFKTRIPFGIGVDVPLLTAETLFKTRKKGVTPDYLAVKTVGDIYMKKEWTLHQFFNEKREKERK